MKKTLCIIMAVLFAAVSFSGCASAKYKKGVDYDDFPDKEIPIYDDAIVFSYEEDDTEWTIEYGTEDDVDDVMDFYRDEFEDEDYIITEEEEDKDEYYVEGYIDEYYFEISAEESSGEEKDYFDTVVEITVEEVEEKETSSETPSEDDIEVLNTESAIVPEEGTGSVGSLDTIGFNAQYDASAFESGSQINVVQADSSDFPEPDSASFEVSDTGYDITLEGADYTRPDEPVTVTVKLSDEMAASLEDEGYLKIAYYFDGEWYLLEPDSVDIANKTATITLYHFSWLFPAKLTEEEIRNLTAENLANQKFNDENNLEQISTQGKSDLKSMITEITGVTDTAALEAISEYMLNENDFTSLALSADKGDYTSFSTKMAEVVAKSINEAASIGDDATMIAGAFQAAGYIWEGDAQGAAEAVANAILDSTAYGKLVKLTITVTDASIKSWKANGIEEMYQAYKNGADEGWFGYNVDKGDFDEVLTQSGAIERQISIDAVKTYCSVNGVTEAELTESEIAEIKQKAIDDLKSKFEARVAKEADIAAYKEYYKNLLDSFEELGVDDSVTMKVDLMDDLTYEQRLESYTRVTQRLLDMTGRKIEFDGLVDDTEIPIDVITTAIKKWYDEDGEAKVKEYLKEKGYLPAVTAESLAGTWSGVSTFTEISIDKEILEQLQAELPEEAADEEGCDMGELDEVLANLEEQEGTTQEFTATVTVSGNTVYLEGNGETMVFSYDEKTGAMTYVSGGDLEEGYNYTISMVVNDTTPLTMHGTYVIESAANNDGDVAVPAGLLRFTITMDLTKTG